MTQLSGTLDGIGLFPLLNFLGSLKAAGRLTIVDADLSGSLFFTDGQVVGATFGADRGQVALDAIGLALGSGRFDFAEDSGERPANLEMGPSELLEHLTVLQSERERIMAAIPSLESVPVSALSAMEGPDDQPIPLDRATLRLLLRCDGRRNVLELARDADLLSTLKRLAKMAELKLIKVEAPRASAAEDSFAPVTPVTPAPVAVSSQDTIVGEAVREPAETAAPARPDTHQRRPWWQGEGP
jgi:hypothetical protein